MVQATGHDSYGLTTLMVWSPVPFSVDQLVAGRHSLPLAGSSSRRESFQLIHDLNSAAVEHSAACVGWLVQLVLISLNPLVVCRAFKAACQKYPVWFLLFYLSPAKFFGSDSLIF